MNVQANELVTKYQGTGRMCKSVRDYNVLMRYLISVVVFGHFQRPSVAKNLTLQEFVTAKKATDGRTIILVADHKTKYSGPAQITLVRDVSPSDHRRV